ncbi:MAG: glycosyltransferase family 2 protein [Candidatus Omnitrophota bacterium]
MRPQSITIIVPAFNEQRNISSAIDSIINALEGFPGDFEMIVFNDGSQDQTGEIAEGRAKGHPQIKIVHNDINRGYGYCYQKGLELSVMEYVGVFPGDNDMAWESLRDLVRNIGEADIIASYMSDMRRRSVLRRILSRLFTCLMNVIFHMKLRYFNGSFICRRKLLRSIPIKAKSLVVIAECLVRLIKSGASYQEICFTHSGRKSERSKALYPKSIVAVLHDVFVLWTDIYLSKSQRNNS